MKRDEDFVKLSRALAELNSAMEACDSATSKRIYKSLLGMFHNLIENNNLTEDDAAAVEFVRSRLTVSLYYQTIDRAENKIGTTNADNNRIATHVQKAVYVIELVCRPKDREGLIGDLLEAYDDVLATYGERRAKTWLRVQVFWTVLHSLKSRLQGMGMAAIGAAFVWMARKIGF